MRTNIIIDDQLMANAMAAGSFTTKKDAVEEGLRLLARRAVYDRILALRGKVHWSLDGDWTKDVAAAGDDGFKKNLRKRTVRQSATRSGAPLV
jgi:Arc/MetJ family transcription regulator